MWYYLQLTLIFITMSFHFHITIPFLGLASSLFTFLTFLYPHYNVSENSPLLQASLEDSFAHHQMSHFIRFHFFFLRGILLKPFVLLQYGLLLSLPLFPYVGAIASWSPCYHSLASFSRSLKDTSMEEFMHTCQSERGRSWWGHPWAPHWQTALL